MRSNTDELLAFIDVAVVAERLCEQMALSDEAMLDYLKARGCSIGGVTQGEKGMLWYDEGGTVSRLPACPFRAMKSSIRRAQATSSTAPISLPISRRRAPRFATISNGPARPRPIRSGISAMRRACRRLPTSTLSRRRPKQRLEPASSQSRRQ